ncbi:subtilisin-like serine protease [Mortierella sp. GBA43]|nr:subtilisin-like serine protease [Mortierella sp. GBA43]
MAVASITFAANVPLSVDTQDQSELPSARDDSEADPDKSWSMIMEKNLKSGYVFDLSKKSTRGYDEDGRQEAVNVGPSMRATVDGQTRRRAGPRSRQRAVLPHKFIVRLKNGVDFSSLDLHAKVAEHNRFTRLPPTRHGKMLNHDGHGKVENEFVPNQVDHEYDFGTWKGYAGQFSPEFVKEIESHEEVEYVEEDTMMWAWGIEAPQGGSIQDLDAHGHHQQELDQQQDLDQLVLKVNGSSSFTAEALGNGRAFEYYSLPAPSWGLTRIAERKSDLRKDYTYMSSAGAGVDVYVIDSGVFEEHKDFEGRATNLASFVPGEEETDTCGHGTHVAGIVAGRRFGVAKAARIRAIKVLDSDGQGSTSQVLAGINYMIRHASNNPNPKKVINMSLGGQFSRPVNDAVRAAVIQHGLPFFVAAGNTGDDACQYSPASVQEAFAVGGSDRLDRVGWYSCVGSCVNIFAPGSGIASDWIRSPSGAHILDGTSMASPHVAGVAALFLGAGNTYESAQQLYDDLVAYSTQDAVIGLYSSDRKTTRNLLYNKMEDLMDSALVRPQGGLGTSEPEEKEASVQQQKPGKKKNKKKKKAAKKNGQHNGHHHHHRHH